LKKLLSTFALSFAAVLCGSLIATAVLAQTTPAPAEVTKPAPAKKPVKPVAKAPAVKPAAAKPVAVAQPVAWPGQLASCKTEAGMNPIKREMCVWKFCKGNWGKGGCPEESKPNTNPSAN